MIQVITVDGRSLSDGSIQVIDRNGNVKRRLIPGADGESAYQLWLDQGNVGSISDFLLSLIGATGPTGPQGIPGAAMATYVFIQNTPVSVWNINHGLGYYPNASVVDSSGSKVEGDIQYIDIYNLIITFTGSFSGEAYLS